MSRPRKIPDATKTKILEPRAGGYSIATIALRCRIGLATVSRALAASNTQEGATAASLGSGSISGYATYRPLTSLPSKNVPSGCVLRENEVVGFILRVAGEAGFHECRIHRFAIWVEMTEPPATRRRVLF
jgi:hypothetical protein